MQLDHGHRWPVPIEKSALLVEHGTECATKDGTRAKKPLDNTATVFVAGRR
jgi:hypothetical protein